jgi:hypothetical protein
MEPHSAAARDLWFAGVRVIVYVDAAQSQGRLGVWESEESPVSACLSMITRERMSKSSCSTARSSSASAMGRTLSRREQRSRFREVFLTLTW